jgi:hypothetical protein
MVAASMADSLVLNFSVGNRAVTSAVRASPTVDLARRELEDDMPFVNGVRPRK